MKIEIPEFTEEQYLETTEPFEWLYNHRNNGLEMKQLGNRMAKMAKAVGVLNFMALFKEYVASLRAIQDSDALGNQTDFDGQEIGLWCGSWEADDGGIHGRDRLCFDIVACPHPILPVRRLTNIDTGLEKIELAFHRGAEPWRKKIFGKNVIADSRSIIKLADYGIAVNSDNAKYLVRYLGEVESLNFDRLESSYSVGRLGWIDGYGFSPYIDNLVFDGEEEYADRFKCVSEHGNYADWLEAIRSIRATEGAPARIVLAASFASTLVKPTGSLPFLLHLWGMGGSGKTVCMMVAASVWANPEMGRYIKSFNSTAVGKELGATFLNSLPLMLDELQIASTGREKFRQMIYEFAEGVGRERGRKSGGLQKTGTWRNCMISTGEEPITDERMTEGARYRTIEIDCGDTVFFSHGNSVGNAKAVAGFFQRNYGFAGKIFVENLQKDMDVAAELQDARAKEIMRIADVDQKQALSAALIIVADELAERWIFQDGITLKAADIAPYLVTKEASDQNKRALEYLYDQAAINAIHFKPEDALQKQTEIWGEIKEHNGRRYLCVINTKFGVLMDAAGFNAAKVLAWARRNGLLRVAANGKATINTRLSGLDGTYRCIWIELSQSAAFDEVDEDELPL